MKPRVILYTATSLDGRTTGFPVDLGLFYFLAQRWDEDATLAGCDTMLKAEEHIPPAAEKPHAEEEEEEATSKEGTAPAAGDGGDDGRPLLVVPDSRGRIRTWGYWKGQPYWRGCVALCSERTPPEHLEYLEAQGIKTIVAGTDHVDLVQALERLNSEFGVGVVRVDSGGTLNAALLRAGLVDELHLLVHPVLVGGSEERTFFADRRQGGESAMPLRFLGAESLEGGLLLVSYSAHPEA